MSRRGGVEGDARRRGEDGGAAGASGAGWDTSAAAVTAWPAVVTTSVLPREETSGFRVGNLVGGGEASEGRLG